MAENKIAQEKLYVREINLLNKKAPGLNLEWLELPAIIKVQTTPLTQANANIAHNKLHETMKNKAGIQFTKLAILVPIRSTSSMSATPLFRIVVDITLLRQLFADELNDWGGGGRKLKNEQTPLSMSMRRR